MGVILNQIALLFLLMGAGYGLKRIHMFDGETDKRYSAFIVNVTIPATILNAACQETELAPGDLAGIAGIAVLSFLLLPVLSWFASKLLRQDGVFTCMLVYSNLGFMGIPIIQSIYGKTYVIYVAVFMMIFNISLFSYGVSVLCHSGKRNLADLLKKLLNPGIISAVAALVLFAAKPPIPAVFKAFLDSVSSVTTPVAMMLIGSSLADIRLKEVFTDWSMYCLAALKLVIFPLILWGILEGLLSVPSEWAAIAVILTGLPVAGNVSMLCIQYGVGQQKAAKGMFVTTVASAATIPVLIYLLIGT